MAYDYSLVFDAQTLIPQTGVADVHMLNNHLCVYKGAHDLHRPELAANAEKWLRDNVRKARLSRVQDYESPRPENYYELPLQP